MSTLGNTADFGDLNKTCIREQMVEMQFVQYKGERYPSSNAGKYN